MFKQITILKYKRLQLTGIKIRYVLLFYRNPFSSSQLNKQYTTLIHHTVNLIVLPPLFWDTAKVLLCAKVGNSFFPERKTKQQQKEILLHLLEKDLGVCGRCCPVSPCWLSGGGGRAPSGCRGVCCPCGSARRSASVRAAPGGARARAGASWPPPSAPGVCSASGIVTFSACGRACPCP